MLPVLRLAWRNLWRNKRRTLITLASVAFNTGILIGDYALLQGLVKNATRNATNLLVGEMQVHAPGYLADRSLYSTVPQPDRLKQQAHSHNIFSAERVYGFGLVAHDTKSAGALFWGVDPEVERATFDLHRYMQSGDYLSSKPNRGLVLGKKLARSLNAKVGDEIVIVLQAADGSLGNEMFHVEGILKAVGETIDRNAAMMHTSDFRDVFVMPEGVHEVALNSRGALPLPALRLAMQPAFDPRDDLKTWRDLMPVLSDMLTVVDVAIWIFGSIFFLVAGLGVMNTMLMATFERVREFGVLKALGATPLRIIGDVFAESMLLSFLGTLLGIGFGVSVALYLQTHGLDTSRLASGTVIAGLAFDPIWYARLSVKCVVLPVAVMWIICVASCVYPALIASRLDPVKAIHHH